MKQVNGSILNFEKVRINTNNTNVLRLFNLKWKLEAAKEAYYFIKEYNEEGRVLLKIRK